MVYQKEDNISILGIVLLNTIFESIAAYKIVGEQGTGSQPASKKDIELSDLNQPLLH